MAGSRFPWSMSLVPVLGMLVATLPGTCLSFKEQMLLMLRTRFLPMLLFFCNGKAQVERIP